MGAVAAIRIAGVWKQYRYGTINHGTLRKDLQSWLARVRGGGDPNAPLDVTGGARRAAAGPDRFWSLVDVSLDVAPGEVLGIIGRNGAGKSTLLKILSRVTAPTRGWVGLRGRVAGLLEIGTGFHPELSGRENVFLNGALLGMRKQEIRRQFDAIVAFAEIEPFVDTPVKRYSSGMYVRLAFAVAAHLEAEILVVDEVLAVGDTQFQQKCLGKLREAGRADRTVLFVSHNLGAVNALCTRGVVLEQGRLGFDGPAEEAVRHYTAELFDPVRVLDPRGFSGDLQSALRLDALRLVSPDGVEVGSAEPDCPLRIVLEGTALRDCPALAIAVAVFGEGVRLFTVHDAVAAAPLARGAFRSTFEIPPGTLRPGSYTLGVGARTGDNQHSLWCRDALGFRVGERWSETTREVDYGLCTVAGRGWREVL